MGCLVSMRRRRDRESEALEVWLNAYTYRGEKRRRDRELVPSCEARLSWGQATCRRVGRRGGRSTERSSRGKKIEGTRLPASL